MASNCWCNVKIEFDGSDTSFYTTAMGTGSTPENLMRRSDAVRHIQQMDDQELAAVAAFLEALEQGR